MSGEWRWADPRGQQRLVRQDELCAALSDGTIPPNAPVWKPGWKEWVPASDVPELMSHALAAANGLVPNVPPPPLFIIAAQSEFESHTPDSRAPTVNVEPPPPPRYVPIAAQSSQPQMPAVAQPEKSPPAAAVQAAVTLQASKKAQAKKKQTMLGIAPPGAAEKKAAEEKAAVEKERPAPVISASPATGVSGAEQLKRGLPSDAPPSSRFGVAQETKGFEPMSIDAATKATHAAQAAAKATVVGVPAIEDPRNKATSAKPPPPAEGGPLKRPTLILYGGAPQAEDAPTSAAPPTAPPIVAPAPGAPVAKNSVTQAPPWDQGAVELGPEIPKSARMPFAEKVEPEDEISASLFIESTDQGPRLVNTGAMPAGGARRPSSMPPPLRPKSMPPPMPGSTSVSRPPDKGRTQRPPPFVPHFQALPDGAAPPPTISLDPNAPLPEPLGTSDILSSNDADGAAKYDSSLSAAVAFRGPSFLAHLDPLVAKWPKLGATRDKLAKLEEGKPRFLLPLLAGLTLFVVLLFFVIVLKAIFGGGASSRTVASGEASSTPSASAAPSSTAATTTATATQSAPTVTPPPPNVSTTPCSVVGSPKAIYPKALVPTGVEVVAADKGVILGFASGPKEAIAIALNPSTLSPIGQTKAKAGEPLKRVEPLPVDGHPQMSANVDKKSDALQGRRTVPSSPAFDIGVANGSLAWATRNSEKTNALWGLSGSGAVEALRGVPLDGGTGIAIAYRRAGAIWLGVATGEKSLSAGNLSSTQGLGPQVGSPAIASSGNAVLAVWADRASSSADWGLRMQRWKVGGTPTGAEPFVPPAGGLGAPYMSPGVASLTDGRFLLVWTEGPAQGHQVRALTIGPDGAPQGDAITISAEGENAGQGQAAVTPDGKGVVGYLMSSGSKGFAVAATAITCPK